MTGGAYIQSQATGGDTGDGALVRRYCARPSRSALLSFASATAGNAGSPWSSTTTSEWMDMVAAAAKRAAMPPRKCHAPRVAATGVAAASGRIEDADAHQDRRHDRRRW